MAQAESREGAGGGGGLRKEDVKSLSGEQLAQLSKQLNQEVNSLTDAAQSLQQGITRVHQSGTSLEQLKHTPTPASAMVPLTGSVYVHASLPDEESVYTVLVDIGTGYYVETSADGGIGFCKRKVQELKQNLDSLGEQISSKREQLSVVESELSQRSQSQPAGA